MYSLGLDYGSNSVRCVIASLADGKEIGTAVYGYETGELGIMLDSSDHNVARQNPADYVKGLELTITGAIEDAKSADSSFDPLDIVGVGVDTTGSTPIPVDENGEPLSYQKKFKDNLNAYAWLWKDHTGFAEAAEITALAEKKHPEYLAKCGGTYSSEWLFSKILHCLNIDEAVFDAADTWVELADFVPAVLTNTTHPSKIKRCICAAGHKAMFNNEWNGLPAKDFLTELNPKLGELRARLFNEAIAIDTAVGEVTEEWAEKLGIKAGIPVAAGAFDCHLGAVGSGIDYGKLVKVIGTSSCDLAVAPNTQKLPDIPGICGIVDGSVLPGHFGLEAGQSAVGDIFAWFVNQIKPGEHNGSFKVLTEKANKYKPGQTGLLALDWNNGNRTVLVDQRLTGLILGQTLHTQPEDMYRALIEATAFGSLTIIKRFEEYGVEINEIINCGGIAEKDAFLMQIYADITGKEMKISSSSQTCALGSAIAGAVVAGKFANFADAQKAMTGVKDLTYKPNPENHKIYQEIYALYLQVHDAFGGVNKSANLANVMKDLLTIKEKVNT